MNRADTIQSLACQEPEEKQEGGKRSQEYSVKRILVAIDGSQMADNALGLAAQVAQKFSAAIDFVHINVMPSDLVAQPSMGAALHPITPESNVHPIEKKELARAVVLADEALLSDRKKLLQSRHVNSQEISISSDSGKVGSEVVRVCNEGKYDLIALGSRGLGAVKGFILGSVSKKVMWEANCSVLLSKVSIDSIRRILLAYDGSPSSKKALALAADLAREFRAPVTLIAVVSTAMMSLEPVLSSGADKLEADMRKDVDEAISRLKNWGASTEEPVIVRASGISSAITKEAEEGFYDLVVLGNRGLGRAKSLFLGSVASGVVNSANANVLIVK